MQIQVQGGRPNEFQTFWQQSDVNLSRGLDFTPRGPVFVRFTHLQHAPFTYNIQVNNQGPQRQGTCRIYLSPKFDERGLPWLFRDQKKMFVELDRFTVNREYGPITVKLFFVQFNFSSTGTKHDCSPIGRIVLDHSIQSHVPRRGHKPPGWRRCSG